MKRRMKQGSLYLLILPKPQMTSVILSIRRVMNLGLRRWYIILGWIEMQKRRRIGNGWMERPGYLLALGQLVQAWITSMSEGLGTVDLPARTSTSFKRWDEQGGMESQHLVFWCILL